MELSPDHWGSGSQPGGRGHHGYPPGAHHTMASHSPSPAPHRGSLASQSPGPAHHRGSTMMASQSPGPGSHRGSSMSGGVGAQSPAAYHRASTGPMPPEQPPQKNNEDATTRKWQDAYMHLKDEKERVSE